MKMVLNIDTDNDDQNLGEMIKQVAVALWHDGPRYDELVPIRDVNGNTVGSYEVKR